MDGGQVNGAGGAKATVCAPPPIAGAYRQAAVSGCDANYPGGIVTFSRPLYHVAVPIRVQLDPHALISYSPE